METTHTYLSVKVDNTSPHPTDHAANADSASQSVRPVGGRKFRLNTASRTNRIGCAYPSDLERTVKNCTDEDRPELLAIVRAELNKVNAKMAELEADMRSHGYKRGTRSGAAWGARFNRAWAKQSQLERAIKDLTS